MEFRIKNHQAFVNGGTLQSEWWTVQRLFGFAWITARVAVPYSIFNEVRRFASIGTAKGYIDEQLSKTKKFKVISELV